MFDYLGSSSEDRGFLFPTHTPLYHNTLATDYMTGYGKVFKEETSTEGAECGSTEGAECGEKGKACAPCGIQANP